MKASIDGVVIRPLHMHSDERGWLMELFRRDVLASENIPAMAYMSLTRPGVTRGPHEHAEQADLFLFTGPSTFRLILWDNRAVSDTYETKQIVEAGENNRLAVVVPPGVVHAYTNIGDKDGMIINAPNRLYGGSGGKHPIDEIRHEDNPDSPFQLE